MRPVTSRSSATPSMRQGAKLPCRNAFTSDSRRAMAGSLSGRGGGARAARMQREAVVGRVREAVLDVAVEGPGERLDRVGRRAAARQGLVELREAVVDHALDERALVAEVMVDGGRGHAGARAELADGEVALGEQDLGGRQDRAPRGLRLGVAGAGESGGAGGHGPLYSAAIF